MTPPKTALLVVAAIGCLALMVLVRDILLLGFIGLLIGVILSFPVGFLSRWMKRGIATVIVLIAIIAVGTGFTVLAAPRVSEQVDSVAQQIPEATHKVEAWFARIQKTAPLSKQTLPVNAGATALLPAARGLTGLITAGILVFILSLFLVANPDGYHQGAKKFFKKESEPVFEETYRRIGTGLRHWVGGIIAAMVMMGVFTSVGLAIAGINDWLLLGALTCFGTFIPYIGAIASAVPGLLIALLQSPTHFLYACIVYVCVHIVEGYIVEPFIMKRAVQLKPAVLLLGQSILGALFGSRGIIVAAPLLVCIQITLDYLYVERTLGKNKSGSGLEAARAA